MPSETLSLFPSPVSISNVVPKSCLKQSARRIRTPPPPTNDSTLATKPEELRGLALQFTPHQTKAIVVEPKQAPISHSLFCGPEASRPDSPMDGIEMQPYPTGSRSPQASPLTQPWQARTRPNAPVYSTSPQSPRYTASPKTLRAASPVHRRTNHPPGQSPPPLPERNLSQQNVQSIFPVYNHSVPLSQQHYFPATDAVITKPEPAARSRSSSAHRPSLKLATSGSVSSSETQMANLSDLQALWSAATGVPHSSRPREIRLAMHLSLIHI